MKKTEPKRGRPAIGPYRRIMVQLADDLVDRIDAAAGPNQRPAFIREAVSRELARRERKG